MPFQRVEVEQSHKEILTLTSMFVQLTLKNTNVLKQYWVPVSSNWHMFLVCSLPSSSVRFASAEVLPFRLTIIMSTR